MTTPKLYRDQQLATEIATAAIDAWKREEFRTTEGVISFIKMEASNDSVIELLAIEKFNESLQKMVGSFIEGLK